MTIIVDAELPGQVRRGTTFKDGRFIRYVDVYANNLIRFSDTEGHTLYQTTDLMNLNYVIQGITAETSSFGDPHIVLVAYGFTEGADGQGKTRKIVASTTYAVAPPEF